MIDLHHHCLPGVDDGPREMAEAVEMCAMAAEEGIETIVATPHVLRGRWATFSRSQLEEQAAALREQTGDRPRLLLGSEYFFAHDMPDVLNEGTAVIPLASSRYVLFELVANAVPPMIEQPLYRAQLDGWVPILAHPERNTVFQAHPELLAELIHHGARVQLTAGSLTGEFGSAAQRAAELFLRLQLVHFVASDSHDTKRRPPRVQAALAVLRQLCGDEVAGALTVGNPAAVTENRTLAWEPEPIEERRRGFLTALRGFLTSH